MNLVMGGSYHMEDLSSTGLPCLVYDWTHHSLLFELCGRGEEENDAVTIITTVFIKHIVMNQLPCNSDSSQDFCHFSLIVNQFETWQLTNNATTHY